MRPLSLTLKNFIGIRSGLNRDEVALDLSRYTGLIALVAANGFGKTTILDNLHPYRLMPSRAAGYTPRQFSYYEETYGDARKLFEWSHGGNVYRSDLYIKGTTKTKKTEAFLYVRTPEGWQPMTLPDGVTSDGKTDTYDACVDHILGSPAMFFTAVFSAQKRKALAEYAAGDIKLLLSDLLALDNLLDLSKRADERAKATQNRYDGMTAALASFDAAEAELRLAEGQIATGQTALDEVKLKREQARLTVSSLTGTLAEARAKASNHDELVRRRQQLQGDLARANEAYNAGVLRMRQDMGRIETEARGDDIESDIIRLRGGIAAMERQIVLHDAAITAGQNGFSEEALAQAMASLQSAMLDYQAVKQKAAGLANAPVRLAQARAKLDKAKTAGKTSKAALDGFQRRAELIDKVPCAGMDINASCELLKDAHGARAQVEPVTAEFEAARTEYHAAQAEINVAELEVAAHVEAQAAVTAADEVTRTADRAVADLERKKHAAATARASEAHKVQVQAQLDDTKQTLGDKRGALEERRRAVHQRLEDLRAQMAQDKQAYEQQKTRLETDIAALPADGARAELAGAERAVEEADQALATLDRQVSTLTTQLGGAQERQAQSQGKLRHAEKARQDAAAVAEDAAQWRLLAKALGRDGIVALSIDDAGPTISTIANDLLTASYGPRFALRFDTQEARKDGSMKESFDIRVFDAERGDDKSISKVSGGEGVWLNDCLCRAIALFQAQQSGKSYECLFSDESDGALDPDHKLQFMRMKRKVLEIGGFTSEFFISHTPELTDRADHRIDVAALRMT